MFPFYTPWKRQKTKGFHGVFKMKTLVKKLLNEIYALSCFQNGINGKFRNHLDFDHTLLLKI